MGKRLGLIIGVNQYKDSTFRPLQFAETDARALAQWLVNTQGGNWRPSDVQMMLGAEASPELVENLIQQYCFAMANPDDLIFIYFAGHTYLDQTSGEGLLAFSDTRYLHPDTGLRLLPLVRDILARSRAAQILFVLDSFQTGAVWNMRRASPYDFQPLFGPTLLSGLQQLQGRLFYCSCRGNDVALERSERNLGAFLYKMIIGFTGPGIDSATGSVTLQRLHAYLSDTLSTQHRPQVYGQEDRPLVLVGEQSPLSAAGNASSVVPPSPPMSAPFSAAPPGPFNASAPQTAPQGGGIATAQLSPTMNAQASLSTVEQNRLQQCASMVNQARQLLQAQQVQQAFQLAESVLQMLPTFVDALILKAQILGSTGSFQEALSIIQQVVQLEPNNALGWSMAAALLANTGQLQEALSAADRSLALDPNNIETRTIRESIEVKLSLERSEARLAAMNLEKRGGPRSVLLAITFHILAFITGIIGASLLVFQPHLPIIIALTLESVSLAALCVNAIRGTYLYGFGRLLLTFVFSLLTGAMLVGGFFVKSIYHIFLDRVVASPPLLVPVLFLGGWLLAAAVLPLVLAIFALFAGIIARARKKR